MLTDENGFLKVRGTLQALSKDNILAAGDCCSIEGCEWIPKAGIFSFPSSDVRISPTWTPGVYAVREGPILANNILKIVQGIHSGVQSLSHLDVYRPQHTFLSLMMTGDGEAIGSYRGIAYTGALAWKLKNKIDR